MGCPGGDTLSGGTGYPVTPAQSYSGEILQLDHRDHRENKPYQLRLRLSQIIIFIAIIYEH